LEEKTNGLPRSFYIVSVASFLFQLSRFTTQPIFTLYVLEMGASLLQLGFILSIQSILMVVVRIPFTIVAERIGKNRMLVIAFVIQATAPLLYAFASDPTWFYIIPFYQIIASGSFNQLAMATASNMAPARRQGDALGRYMTFMSMGMFVGPLITSLLVAFISYRQLYLVTALFPAVGLALFLRYIPKGEAMSQALADQKGEKTSTVDTLRVILGNRNVLVLTLVRTTYSLSNTVFTSLFALYAVERLGFTPSMASLLFSVVGFANAFIKFPAGRLADRLGAKVVLMASFSTLILVFVSIAYLRGFVPILGSLVLFGACWGTRAVTEWTTLANTVTAETKAMAMSYLSSIWGVGATLGSLMVGLVGGALSFSTIFLILALINVPALPAIYTMKGSEEN
jgi:predicted MFS family arabinose efflux permease